MITLKADERQRILTVEAAGKISEADLDAAIDSLEKDYPAVSVRLRGDERGFVVVLDWERLEGWDKGAKTLGTVTSRLIADAARKVAVIADDRWSDERARLIDLAKGATVRFFAPADREQALAWVTAP